VSPTCSYVTERVRNPRDINPKSCNLNNCLCNIIYAEHAEKPAGIPHTEVVVIFDADMACKKEFFLKVLEVMWEDDVALCLTPQVRARLAVAAASWLAAAAT
jgi:hypothetical protein